MRSSYAEYSIDHLWTKGALTLRVTSAFDASIYGATSVGDLVYDFSTEVTTVKGRLRGGNAARLPAFFNCRCDRASTGPTLVADTPKIWRLRVCSTSTWRGDDAGHGGQHRQRGRHLRSRDDDRRGSKRMTKLMDEPVEIVESFVSRRDRCRGAGAATPLTVTARDFPARWTPTSWNLAASSLLSGALASRRLTMTAEGRRRDVGPAHADGRLRHSADRHVQVSSTRRM
jgi:hypothetical protein